jgi:hypothetical protein
MATQVDSVNAQLSSLMESMLSYSKRTVTTNTSRKREKHMLDSATMAFPTSLSFSSGSAVPLTLPSPKQRKTSFRSHTYRAPGAKNLTMRMEGIGMGETVCSLATDNLPNPLALSSHDSRNDLHISTNSSKSENNVTIGQTNGFQFVDMQLQPCKAGKMRGRKRSSGEMQRGSSRRSTSTMADGTPARAKKHITEEQLRLRAAAKEHRRSKTRGWKENDARHYPIENSIAQAHFAHINAEELSLFQRYYHIMEKYGVSQKTLSDVLQIFNCTISQVVSGAYKFNTIGKYTRRCRVWVFLMDRQLVTEMCKAWCQLHGIGLNSFVSHAAEYMHIPICQLQRWFDGTCPVVNRNDLDRTITAEIVKRNPEFRITLNPYAGIPKFKHYAHYNTDKDKEKDKLIIRQRMGVMNGTPVQRHSKKADKLTQHEILRAEEEKETKEVTAVFDTVYRNGFIDSSYTVNSFPTTPTSSYTRGG